LASLAAATWGSVTVVESNVTRAARGVGTKSIAIDFSFTQLRTTRCPQGISSGCTSGS
jgi:hypothetical protein